MVYHWLDRRPLKQIVGTVSQQIVHPKNLNRGSNNSPRTVTILDSSHTSPPPVRGDGKILHNRGWMGGGGPMSHVN